MKERCKGCRNELFGAVVVEGSHLLDRPCAAHPDGKAVMLCVEWQVRSVVAFAIFDVAVRGCGASSLPASARKGTSFPRSLPHDWKKNEANQRKSKEKQKKKCKAGVKSGGCLFCFSFSLFALCFFLANKCQIEHRFGFNGFRSTSFLSLIVCKAACVTLMIVFSYFFR